VYNVSKIARIDPTTGKVTEWDLPGPRDGRPYPSGIDAKDRFWTQTAKDDVLIMFDPKTERFTTYLMPNKGTGLRDFYVDEEGWMWTAVWGRNQVLGFRLEED
jgi:streptogramin lyase